MTRTTRFFAVAMLAAGLVLAQSERSAEVQLKAAMHKEQVEGDLKAAIKLYQGIVEKYAGNKAVAAKALLQMGQCYEKLGQADARKTYERLLRDYQDQREPAEQARARLAILGVGERLTRYSGITLRKVSEEGTNWVSFSPDGRFILLVDWEKGGNLAVRDLVTGEKRPITKQDTSKSPWEYSEGGFISPDGKRVVYTWVIEGPGPVRKPSFELRVVGLDASEPRVIYRGDAAVSDLYATDWTSDGKSVLVVICRAKERTNQMALISVADGSLKIVKTLAWRMEAPYFGYAVSLSPDGRYIVYDQWLWADSPQRDISLISASGTGEVPLVQHPADDHNPTWTPDGKEVLFTSDRMGKPGLWIVPVADGKPQGPARLVKSDTGELIGGAFTTQGSYSFCIWAGMSDVYLAEVDPQSGKLSGHSAEVAARRVGATLAPSFSPDGRYLAYYVQRGDRNDWEPGGVTLVIRSLQTGEERDVPVKLFQVASPIRWFSDGRSVLVSAWNSDPRVDFYKVDTQTGDYRLLLKNTDSGTTRAELSPDGKTLFYWQGDDWQGVDPPKVLRIIAREVENGRERDVARIRCFGWAWDLAISPDGKRLAILAPVDESKSAVIQLVPTDGGAPRELYRLQQSDVPYRGEIAWTPDGRNLLVMRRAGKENIRELWLYPADRTAEPRSLGFTAQYMREPAVHPDGRRIAFTAGAYARSDKVELWVIDNLLPVLRSGR